MIKKQNHAELALDAVGNTDLADRGSCYVITPATGYVKLLSPEPPSLAVEGSPHAPRLDGLPGTALAWALAYAEAGWSVFPCKSDKTPLTINGFKDGTDNPHTIKAWWTWWSHAEIGWAVPGRV
jgi:Bifunctional DNA primase/polymerase, N-terminal